MEQPKQKKTSSTIVKVALNLLIMLGIVFVLGWGAFIWMDAWTLHGNVRTVPDVKGLNYNQAAERLAEAGLQIELSDSIYRDSARPGQVLEQNPKGNNQVKPGRVVYVTINAFSPRTVSLPPLTQVSQKQAMKDLESRGISNIRIVMVPSEFGGLVLAAKCNGHVLQAGARVAINSVITLEVGDGLPDLPDSVLIEDENTGMAAPGEMLDLN